MHRLLNRLILEKTEDFYYGLGFLQSRNKFTTMCQAIRHLHLKYRLHGPNCNSVTYTLLKKNGFTPDKPPGMYSGWGWGQILL